MSNVKLIESKHIRSVWNEADSKAYFSVADVLEFLAAGNETVTSGNDLKELQARISG